MPRQFRFELLSIITILAVSILILASSKHSTMTVSAQAQASPGALEVLDAEGKPRGLCPLKHTDVKAQISGFISRVVVTQEFANPFKEKIEAVYIFPLPHNAAVDDMTMTVGDRVVRGKILRREEARAVYEAAKTSGQVASLLDQERPNIFTQSVANILPGEQVKITISYVETLKYTNGAYEFVFPMVVGPRYIPAATTEAQPNADHGSGGTQLNAPLAPAGMRAGHDVSLEIELDAGVPIDELVSRSHKVDLERPDSRRAHVRLQNKEEIPNKDFVLRFDVAGKKIEDALLTHRSGQGGFFTLILQPPEKVSPEDFMPRELVFVLDTSGSMSGFPIEKAKETMKLALANLNPYDTFNLITFAGDTNILFPEPVAATKENLRKAQLFLEARKGNGGTEMMKAIKAALEPSDAQGHVRIVCFMTDGYVGNEMEIIGEVQKHPNARVFAFGIGGSVNRFLLDKMAQEGRGEVEYVALEDDGSAAAHRFHERVHGPLLTDMSIDWAGLPATDVYPKRIPDLFSAKPVIVTGRFTGAASGTAHLRGMMSGKPITRDIAIVFPESETGHDVLPALWARSRVDDLLSQDYQGAQRGIMKLELRETITQLGLEYRLMTQFTSFVAVEEMVVTEEGVPRRIDVPIEVPEGVNREGVAVNGLIGNAVNQRQSMSLYFLRSANTNVITKSGTNTKRRGSQGGGGSGKSGPGSVARVASSNAAPAPQPSIAYEITESERDSSEGKEPKRAALEGKVHPWILAVIDRLQSRQPVPGADEANFIRDGKADLQIFLTDKSEATMAQLRALGIEVVLDPKSARLVIGRLPIDKLSALAELPSVRYIGIRM